MEDKKKVFGFSKMSKYEKIQWIAKNFLYNNPIDVMKDFAGFWHDNVESQKLFEGFSENTISNFYMPFGIAPNFNINGKIYAIPMVIEESSVVAAASNAAKFWMDRGGFKAEVLSTRKVGQIHFTYKGDKQKLFDFFPHLESHLRENTDELTASMEARGGGVREIELLDLTAEEADLFQIRIQVETCDSMGANFINSVLEEYARLLVDKVGSSSIFTKEEQQLEVIMSILSNYTPECTVRARVSCHIDELGHFNDDSMDARSFAERFCRAVRIAKIDPYRATTHNKGVMNGIDAVVIATGNDFRAVESCLHTHACRNGRYESLTEAWIEDDVFHFQIEAPLALGTVGGLTSLHPLAKKSLEILGNPGAEELMMITATVGLAQNFAAVKSLVTTGIQAGHMKMHLTNILNQLQATEEESLKVREYFLDRVISFNAVREFLENLRQNFGYPGAGSQ